MRTAAAPCPFCPCDRIEATTDSRNSWSSGDTGRPWSLCSAISAALLKALAPSGDVWNMPNGLWVGGMSARNGSLNKPMSISLRRAWNSASPGAACGVTMRGASSSPICRSIPSARSAAAFLWASRAATWSALCCSRAAWRSSASLSRTSLEIPATARLVTGDLTSPSMLSIGVGARWE